MRSRWRAEEEEEEQEQEEEEEEEEEQEEEQEEEEEEEEEEEGGGEGRGSAKVTDALRCGLPSMAGGYGDRDKGAWGIGLYVCALALLGLGVVRGD